MCGRFYIAEEAEDELLHHLISELNRKQGSQAVTKGEVRPADHAMIIANSRQLTPSLFTMQWGYTLDTGARLINARSETAEEKRMFCDGFTRRRCLVPASGYYEWRKIGRERQQYAIKPQRTSHCFFAGIYRFEQEKPVFITGRESAAKKEDAVDRFMAGKTDLCCISLRAASGLNLQRATCVVFGELDWSPAVHSQAEDRAHRMGQRDSLLCYYLVSPRGSDQEMQSALGLKVSQFLLLMGDAPQSESQSQAGANFARQHVENLVQRMER